MVMSRSSFGKLTTTVPPKSGPVPQGLNIQYNTVKTVRENLNGRNRQSVAQRNTRRKIT
jgi:predicted AlkP superfamily phosphohydrolase/phosphomutase